MSRSTLLIALACVVATALAAPEGYSPTPNGYMLSECVRSIPSGATVMERSDHILITRLDGSAYRLPLCEPAGRPLFHRANVTDQRTRARTVVAPETYVGWTEYTAYHHTEDLVSFLGYFSVPDRPKESPEVLYLFTGLQNIDWIPVVDPEPRTDFDIIQPVLQYPGKRGEWGVRSWYVTLAAGALSSDLVDCVPGDSIFGNMTRTGPESYYIGSTVVRTGETTVTNAHNKRLTEQPWAYNTLECYGCSSCKTYPTLPSVFTQLSLSTQSAPVTPQWIANPKPSQYHLCNESVSIANATSVTIHFT